MLRVERTGPRGRPPIILIPALFCGSWEWEREITLLGADHEVFAVTLPGFDGRPRDEGGDLMARAAGDLDALIRTHHLDHPLLVGHSLGGTLAVLFAESYPNSAGDIVTVEGGLPIAPTPAARAARIRAATAPYRTIPDSLFGPVLRDNMLKYVITRPEDVDRVTPLAARSDRIAVIRWMEAALSLDLSPGMGSITVPLTAIIPYDSLIDGYQGYATEAAKRATYAAWLAPARRGGVVMIPHARHFVMIDRPEAFDLALLAAIAPTGPPPR